MYPSQTRIITAPIDVSTLGDNVLITNPTTDPAWAYIKQIEVIPEAAVRMTFKAVHPVNGDRVFTGDALYQSGQGFIFESFDGQAPYVFELHQGENLVLELSAGVACKGFVNYTLNLG